MVKYVEAYTFSGVCPAPLGRIQHYIAVMKIQPVGLILAPGSALVGAVVDGGNGAVAGLGVLGALLLTATLIHAWVSSLARDARSRELDGGKPMRRADA